MAFSTTCQCFFIFILLVMVASPLQINARESKFFSKVLRTEPKTEKPKTQKPKTEPEPEPVSVSPSPSPSAETESATELGYGLFGKEETYEYPPTTTNPTKSEPEKLKYVHPNWVKEGGNHYEAGEKLGMSDTRFLENGKYYYDINSEKKVGSNGELMEEDDGHESYYGNNYEHGNEFQEERYETGEKQGMSDTRYWENGRYYDVNAVNNNDHGSGYSKRAQFSRNKYENQFYGTGEKQGISDTRFLENGKYYYDINAEKNTEYNENPNGVEFYNNRGKSESYENQGKNEYYEKQGNQFHGTEEKQGMSDTRFLENGQYYYDINAERNEKYNEDPNGVKFYNNQGRSEKSNEYYEKERYEPGKFNNQVESFDTNYEKEEFDEKTEGKFGKGYDFRSTPNKFPNYEFDSIDEYEKYEQARSHQKQNVP